MNGKAIRINVSKSEVNKNIIWEHLSFTVYFENKNRRRLKEIPKKYQQNAAKNGFEFLN